MTDKKQAVSTELETIMEVLEKFPNGATIEEIQEAANLALRDRTLQRRLKTLIDQQKIIATGGRKTRVYKLAAHMSKKSAELGETIGVAAEILLTETARQYLAEVTKPLAQRHPVGYRKDFLEDYRPNKTSYLNDIELNRLRVLGQTANMHQPAGTYARQILNRLLIDLSWNSSRLEGNSYSLLETHRLLEEGRLSNERKDSDTQMILNHKDAIEFLVQNADDSVGFNRHTIVSLHALLSNNLLPDSAASGRLRTHAVGIGRSVYHPPDTPQVIEECFSLFLDKAQEITNPFEQAFFAMVHIPYLQPFDDVNKRVSRLAANIPLNNHNLAPLSFTDTPEELYISGLLAVYELNQVTLLKEVFIYAYERSAARYAQVRQTLGEPDPFRLKYRIEIAELIQRIIKENILDEKALNTIEEKAQTLPPEDMKRFMNAVETELMNLHEGNFARYKVTPSEFNKWHHDFLIVRSKK